MATISAVVFKHQKKSNGSFPAKIRITQFGKSVYIDTGIEVSPGYVDRNFKIKKAFIDKTFAPIISEYWSYLTPHVASQYSAERIKLGILNAIAEPNKLTADQVDFMAFTVGYVDRLVSEGRINSAVPFRTLQYTLQDYVGKGRNLSPVDITSKWLEKYEAYIRTPRKLIRRNHDNSVARLHTDGLTDSGVAKHMANLRTVFNACADYYNDYDTGDIVIANKPFFRYKIKVSRVAKVRHLTVPDLIKLYQSHPVDDREKMSKELFFLSFFLCGMNSVDFYHYLGRPVVNGRIEYNRSKTKGERDDNAFFSVKIPKCGEVILVDYRRGVKTWYSSDRTFNRALNNGLKTLARRAGLDVIPTFYFARHTFATIARNDCNFDMERVAAALNHSSTAGVTDRYIAKDWSKVDEIQSAVLKFFFNELNKVR